MVAPKDFTIHMIGHGHIDPTWLWRWTEGYGEVRATFRSALDRMNETPEFKFIASSACFYEWVKACDPAMFEEIRQRVAEGRWEVVGGWWVEPDCNIPGGEAMVRHGLYSQRFFERELGVRAKVGFNPDTFGHAGTLPQIYCKMGIEYYAYMRPGPVSEMHYPEGTTFWWVADDGSRLLASNIVTGYGSGDNVLDKIKATPSNIYLNTGQTVVMGFYGVGNHGGGPTKRAIAQIIEAQKDEELPDTPFSTLLAFFEDFQRAVKEQGGTIPTIATELQHHARGCYSVHSEIKRLNRAGEHALMTAERFATLAWLLKEHPYPQERIEGAWKDVMYNQFHDILAGTSIETSYEDSRDQLGRARHTAHEILNESWQTIAGDIDTSGEGNPVLMVNPLPWPVKQTITVPEIAWRTLKQQLHFVDEEGQVIPSQAVRGARTKGHAWRITTEVPALGYRCFHARSEEKDVQAGGTLEAGRDFLENDWWRIEFDPYHGHISRLYDKKRQVETVAKANVLAAIVDHSDTWSHGVDEFRVEAGRFSNAVLERLELGPVQATIRVVSRFRDSTVEQFVTIYRDSEDIDCVFRVNWQERYTMLKLAYETRIDAGEATYDVPYGYEVRGTDGWEEPGQKWFDMTGTIDGKSYGLAVLNDSKYSYDVWGNHMRVTLLRSPLYGHHDRGRINASEPWPAMDQGWQTVCVQLVPHAGGWREAGVVKKSWELNEPVFAHIECCHEGTLPPSCSLFSADADNAVVSVLKKSEDGAKVVVRGYETAGQEAQAKVTMHGRPEALKLAFAPHEIKTMQIEPGTGAVEEVDLLEEKS